MLLSLLRPLRLLVKGLQANDSPRQIALGVSIGMLMGLIPKGNLIAAALVVLLLSLKVNRGAGVCIAVVFSWIGVLLDPLSHRIGLTVLTSEPLQPLLAWMYDAPVLPWTSFHNTVVVGSIVVGLCLLYPVYRLSDFAAVKYLPRATERLSKYRIYRVLFGTELATGWKLQ